MRNKIRHYRQIRGLKLRELASRVGTTPQSVSRLETGNMTLSVDWLERFARALDIHPADLLEQPEGRDAALLGDVVGDGHVIGRETTIDLHIPSANPVAVRVVAPIGGHAAGDILIGDRIDAPTIVRIDNRIAIVESREREVFLARVTRAAPGLTGVTLIPLAHDGPVRHGVELIWAAPLVMALRYLA